jgi:hypothetical protein
MDSYPNLALPRAAPPHHAHHKLRFDLQLALWERVCTKLRVRLVIKSAETIVFIQNYLSRNTLPSTGGDWEVSFRTLEGVAVENEQRDVEGGVSGLLMHESRSGTPVHSSAPLLPTSALHDCVCCGLLIYTSNMMLCVFSFLKT